MEQNPNGCALVFTFKSNIRMGGILSGNMLKLNSNIVKDLQTAPTKECYDVYIP